MRIYTIKEFAATLASAYINKQAGIMAIRNRIKKYAPAHYEEILRLTTATIKEFKNIKLKKVDKLFKGDIVALEAGHYADRKDNPAWEGKYGKTTGVVKTANSRGDFIDVLWSNGILNTYGNHQLFLIKRA